jgi:hypothetical protein
VTAHDDLIVKINRLKWQVDIMVAESEAEMRRARFRFVRLLRTTYARHPFIARAAWWYWRHWLGRGWDMRRVKS